MSLIDRNGDVIACGEIPIPPCCRACGAEPVLGLVAGEWICADCWTCYAPVFLAARAKGNA